MSTQTENVEITYRRERWFAQMGGWVPDGQGAEGEPALEKLLGQLRSGGVQSCRIDLSGVPAEDEFSRVNYMRAFGTWIDSILPAVVDGWAASGVHLVGYCWRSSITIRNQMVYWFDGVQGDIEAREADLRSGAGTAVASIYVPAVSDPLVGFKNLMEEKAQKLAVLLAKEFENACI